MTTQLQADFHVPLVIRGRVINDREIEAGGRRAGASFTTADVRKHLHLLPLNPPSAISDLYSISFEEILDYLEALGQRLVYSQNRHLQDACALASKTSGLTPEILRFFYETLDGMFTRSLVRDVAEKAIGVPYLEGWVATETANGCHAAVRAFGARSAHVLAGNVPAPSAASIIRNAITRSDAILKTPSNDPLTSVAIALTMIEMAPDHPITRHLSVGYWKGGDDEVESVLYQPENVEKIIAWGGEASIRHIAKYIQPGIDLITLDPKHSSSIIGSEAFKDEATMKEVAARLACDVGGWNQEACANARTIYIQSGTDASGMATADHFGELLYQAIQDLPPIFSSPAVSPNLDLLEEVQMLKMSSDEHKVIGGTKAGGVIVSHDSEPLDFARSLANRIASLVPIDDINTAIRSVNSYTQTIGIYPDSLKEEIRDQLVFQGCQRPVSLGYALKLANAGPHDGIELLRRMCKWIVSETFLPSEVGLLSSGARVSGVASRKEPANV